MNEIKIQRPDGVQSTYRINNPETWAALDAKPRKARTISDKRLYPKRSGLSTAEYVRQYFELNTQFKIAAYAEHIDHCALYAPLNTKPATWAPDTVEIEIVECAA